MDVYDPASLRLEAPVLARRCVRQAGDLALTAVLGGSLVSEATLTMRRHFSGHTIFLIVCVDLLLLVLVITPIVWIRCSPPRALVDRWRDAIEEKRRARMPVGTLSTSSYLAIIAVVVVFGMAVGLRLPVSDPADDEPSAIRQQ